jgi:hypothetical protein
MSAPPGIELLLFAGLGAPVAWGFGCALVGWRLRWLSILLLLLPAVLIILLEPFFLYLFFLVLLFNAYGCEALAGYFLGIRRMARWKRGCLLSVVAGLANLLKSFPPYGATTVASVGLPIIIIFGAFAAYKGRRAIAGAVILVATFFVSCLDSRVGFVVISDCAIIALFQTSVCFDRWLSYFV